MQQTNCQKKGTNVNMDKQLSTQPILSIDLKKYRIRIHKITLEMLGNPKYVQLLINPQSKIIALRPSSQGEYSAHRVNLELLEDGYCCELYSYSFMHRLCQINSTWKYNQSYRIYGNLAEHNHIACFGMENIKPINNDW